MALAVITKVSVYKKRKSIVYINTWKYTTLYRSIYFILAYSYILVLFKIEL